MKKLLTIVLTLILTTTFAQTIEDVQLKFYESHFSAKYFFINLKKILNYEKN